MGQAVLDAVYSLQLDYSIVENVMRRYQQRRIQAGFDVNKDGLTELIECIRDEGGVEGFSMTIGTTNTSVRATKKLPATRKTQTAREAAIALQAVGIETADDLRAAINDPDRRNEVRRAWLSVRGLGAVSWDYLMMLVGQDGTKPDTMVCRFVGAAVSSRVGPDRARIAMHGAATILGVETGALDRAVWRFQSGRTPD